MKTQIIIDYDKYLELEKESRELNDLKKEIANTIKIKLASGIPHDNREVLCINRDRLKKVHGFADVILED